jgi:hypothetical protein
MAGAAGNATNAGAAVGTAANAAGAAVGGSGDASAATGAVTAAAAAATGTQLVNSAKFRRVTAEVEEDDEEFDEEWDIWEVFLFCFCKHGCNLELLARAGRKYMLAKLLWSIKHRYLDIVLFFVNLNMMLPAKPRVGI